MSESANSTLFIDLSERVVRPGGSVAGSVYWDLPEAPKSITIRMGWWTEGRGTRDQAIFETVDVPAPGSVGKESFVFNVAPMPLSFSGKLISLRWGIEVEKQPGNERVVEEFVVGHGDAELDISREDHEGPRKSIRFGKG